MQNKPNPQIRPARCPIQFRVLLRPRACLATAPRESGGNRNTMAAALSLTQLSGGNPVYDKYYRQVDPNSSGRVAADAAVFLKRSGLADLVLGKIWDLADSERKGFLNKQQFFIGLRLVACAQNGLEVALKSLGGVVPPPKFHETSSPLLAGVSADAPWVVKPEEKMKFDSIFDSLGPVGGILTGDKVKPVLLNSKLPVDILGRVVWELSDIDRDGMLDRDEFSVAMYLVYRALEGEPVPMSLPPPLVPPSKRKKWVVMPADKAKYDELFSKTDSDMDGLVSGPEVRDIFLKTGLPSATLARIWELCDIGDIGKLTREQFALALHLINQKLTKGVDPPPSLSPEMIPPSDRHNMKQNNTANLAADFSAIKELDSLSNEIIELQRTPRERSSVEDEIKEKEEAIRQHSSEVQDLQDEVAKESSFQRLQAQRQKVQQALEELDQQKGSLEEQLTHIRQQTNQETQLISSLQTEHEEQEQMICHYEEELVQAREELLALQEESKRLQEKVQAAQEQLTPLQESVRDSFTQVAQVQQKLNELKEEERSVTAQLSWKRALEDSSPVMVNGSNGSSGDHQGDLFQQDLFQEDKPRELREEESAAVATELMENPTDTENVVASPGPERKPEAAESTENTTSSLAFHISSGSVLPPGSPPSLPEMDFFNADPFTDHDPFKDDPFGKADVADPFGGDPFKGSDPFAADSFFAQTSKTAFSTDGATDPFSSSSSNSDLAVKDSAATNDPFAPGGTTVNASSDPVSDPFAAVFGNESFGGGFADFSALAKSNGADQFGIDNKNLFQEENSPAGSDVPPALPPKTGTPTRPPPPPPGKRSSLPRTESNEAFQRRSHFHSPPLGDFSSSSSLPAKDPVADPFAPSSPPCHNVRDADRFASFDKYPTEEDMIEWAKRESEREEKERLARLTQQEQEDLELAIALSKSELS
uniref:Epidermal growth factor receptor pathway substrate 15 n=1 Tax=Tetraodon nigroviridis TaxID=99883 RepID=H3DDG8_TETNG